MSFKDALRALTPGFLLHWNRERKKNHVRKELMKQKESGNALSYESLIMALKNLGLKSGDDVLVHSSLSKIGYIDGGAEVFIQAILDVVGKLGNVLMPTSPNAGYQLDYIRNLKEFDVQNAPSALGKITEVFRTWPGAMRSASPTEPVSCVGPDAHWYTSGHLHQKTPYSETSPFARLAQKGGKILYVGVTLDNAGTSLHVLEDAVSPFKFPVYYPEEFHVSIKLPDGTISESCVKVHNPEQSALRKCDELLPWFKANHCYTEAKIGAARTLVFDAKAMLSTMIDGYNQSGITMYTPKGSN